MGFEENLCIDEVDMFEDHLVVYCRENATPRVRVYDLRTGKFDKIELKNKEEVFSIQPGVNMDYFSKDLRFTYSSPVNYETTYNYNLDTKLLTKLNEKKLGGVPFYASNFICQRLEVPSHDGLMIPLTIFHRSDLKKDRK